MREWEVEREKGRENIKAVLLLSVITGYLSVYQRM